jgi:predicted ATPase
MSKSHHDIKKIVLTGGPGAGKTAVLEMFKKLDLSRIAILPEAASIIFNGGFWRLPSISARASAQRAIYKVQTEMEKLVEDERAWDWALCDRGTLDGLAYWPYDEQSFWDMNETTITSEMEKYYAIIHLRTPLEGRGYNNQNPLRVEDSIRAQVIDQRIGTIWQQHPKYFSVENQEDFLLKAKNAIDCVNQLIH